MFVSLFQRAPASMTNRLQCQVRDYSSRPGLARAADVVGHRTLAIRCREIQLPASPAVQQPATRPPRRWEWYEVPALHLTPDDAEETPVRLPVLRTHRMRLLHRNGPKRARSGPGQVQSSNSVHLQVRSTTT